MVQASQGRISQAWLLLVLSLQLPGCGSREAAPASVEFTKVPDFAPGSAVKMLAIEGRASGVQPGTKVVLYAKSGEWWVQPLASKPLTEIAANSTWRSTTHPGNAYAALLVNNGYHPNLKLGALPEKGGGVLAVAVAQAPGVLRTGSKKLNFGGYEWQIRDVAYEPGGSRNKFGSANVSIDSGDALHLRITGKPGNWTSAEVDLLRSLGYGTYRFVVRDVSRLEPAAVFTMMTADDDGPAREMDIELSRWGEAGARNAQFVIQPYHIPANTIGFEAPGGTVTFMLRWEPARATFRAFQGAVSRWASKPFREHIFTSGVPLPGTESVRINLYVFDQIKNSLRKPTEVIIDKFEYLP